MSTSEPEQILGAIYYSAISGTGSYDLRSIIFTDREMIQVPLSKMSELAPKVSTSSKAASWALVFTDANAFMGLQGLLGMKRWSALKKNLGDKPQVGTEKSPLPSDILNAAIVKMPYEKIKEVKLKKVMMSSDWYLGVSAGFLHSQNIVFDGRAVDQVKNLIMNTPLATKLKS